MKHFSKVLTCLSALWLPMTAQAADFPDRPITLIVGAGPGSSNDIFARYIADGLTKAWGQPVAVENMPGGGSTVAAAHISRAEPDGTRLLVTSATYATNAASGMAPFDPLVDVLPVAKFADVAMAVVAGKRLAITSLADLKDQAGKERLLVAGTGAVGQPTLLSHSVLDALAVQGQDVDYTGGAEALLDLMGGRVDIYSGAVATVMPAIQSGDALPIAVFSAARQPLLPDTQTVGEQGYPQLTTDLWYGVFAPGQTPPQTAEIIAKGIADVMATDEAKAFFARQGAIPSTAPPAPFKALVAADIERWKAVMQATKP